MNSSRKGIKNITADFQGLTGLYFSGICLV